MHAIGSNHQTHSGRDTAAVHGAVRSRHAKFLWHTPELSNGTSAAHQCRNGICIPRPPDPWNISGSQPERCARCMLFPWLRRCPAERRIRRGCRPLLASDIAATPHSAASPAASPAATCETSCASCTRSAPVNDAIRSVPRYATNVGTAVIMAELTAFSTSALSMFIL